MVEVWKIAVGVAVPLVILVILLAVLIPRPVPCDEYAPRIDTVVTVYPDPANSTNMLEAPIVCLAPLPGRDMEVDLTGVFMITGPPEGASWGKPPKFYWAGEEKASTTSECRDLEVWMRPGVYACSGGSFNGSHINITDAEDATNPVGLVTVGAELREPCKINLAEFQLTAISQDKLAFNVSGVEPNLICLGSGETNVTIYGQGFVFYRRLNDVNATWTTPTVFYQGIVLNSTVEPVVASCRNRTLASPGSFPVEVLVCTNFSVHLPNQESPLQGADNLTVVNAGPCVDGIATISNAVKYSSGTVRVFAAAPDIVYNGISMQVTLYVSGLDATNRVRRITFEETTTGARTSFNADSSAVLNQVKVTLPSMNLTAGVYDVIVEAVNDPVGCSGRLLEGVTVVDVANLNITSIEPRDIWINAVASAITVYANGGLIDSPVMYVSQPSISASAVSAVSFQDASTVSGVVRNRGTLSAGLYDIIVINPDRSVGVLRSALEIVTNPPPVITLVKPDSVPGAAVPAQITGANFVTPTIRLDCISSTNTRKTINLNATSFTSTTINVTWPSGSVGDFCVVVVVNVDGVEAKYSGISFKGTSLNLDPFKAGSYMQNIRRAAAVALARPTEATRYLYTMGGDRNSSINYITGNVGAYDTVESVPVDRLGTMGTWTFQRNKLPTPCTYSDSRVISMFVYLLCGHTTSAPTNKIYRAQVLDPLQTPELDLDINVDENATGTNRGVFATGGQFVYRISAVFPANDDSNPSGESLPGEPLSLKLPRFAGVNGTFVLTIKWDAIPGASSYRIYRTASSTSSTTLGLLREEVATSVCNATACQFTDRGNGTAPDAAVVPYVPGSLGSWHEVAALTTPRAWGALAHSPQPGVTPSNTHYLYAFGGIPGTGAGDAGALNTFESATVTLTASTGKSREVQSVSAWVAGSSTMQSGRYNLMTSTMDPSVAPNLPGLQAGSFYIHVGPGNNVGGAIAQEIEITGVSSTGALNLTAIPRVSPGARQGACMFAFTTNVGELGFIGGRGSAQGTAGKMEGTVGCSGVACLATFGTSWNAGWDVSPVVPQNTKCIKVKPFVYMAGGIDGVAATNFTAFNYV